MKYIDIKDKVEKIEGWMDPPDMEWLFNTAQQIPENGVVIELGSWKGRSSSAILSGLKNQSLFCIDKWSGNTGDYEDGYNGIGIKAYNEFIINLRNVVNKIPYILTADSSKSSILFENNSIDWIFIDANHEIDDVENDVRSWLPKLKSGAILSGHDWRKAGGAIPKALERILYTDCLNITESSIWYSTLDKIRFR